MYTDIKAKEKFTQLINACVSHELRNPLNSIIAKNIQKDALYKELIDLFGEIEMQFNGSPIIKRCMGIMKELNAGKLIQQNSSELMAFLI